MVKKKILFVIESLDCGGGEKSLVSLLNLLNYKKYDVDLQLFSYGGIFEKLLPKEVNLLEPLEYMKFSTLSLKNAVIFSIKNKKYKFLLARLLFSIKIRKKNCNNREICRFFWESISKCIPVMKKKYDIAISYSQGISTFYVADKINSEKKFTWINTGYHLYGIEKIYQKSKYKKFDKIILVSDTIKNIFEEIYPEFDKKYEVIYDINNSELIEKMSEYGEKLKKEKEKVNLLTIGRLSAIKGYDIALEACNILKNKGVNFTWYILGEGALENEIKEKVEILKLKEHFILLGITSNPYGYIKSTDIYVQTSRYEGFGLAIAEARILNVPVVTTEFDAVYNQMVQRKNGIVTQMNAQSVADGIMELIENKELKNSIIEYLKNEKKGNLEEYEKFEKLIEE